MRTLNKLMLSLLFFTAINVSGFAQDCSILKNNHFTYKLNGDDVQVEFKEDKHIELHQNGKYFIISSIEWISDCEYNLTFKRVTLVNFPFKVGDKLHVKILRTRGDRVYFKSTVNNFTWEGKMTKVKKKKEEEKNDDGN